MCGRFSQEAELSEIKLELKVEQLELFREFRPVYNIAPSYGPGAEQVFVIQTREGRRVLRQGRWWLIPHFWSKPLKALPAAFNARSEELELKPFWRDAFRAHRCLVPATGWREFKAEGKRKQPYQFRLGQKPFAFAGLWSRWTSPDGELIDSFTVLTTDPNPQAAQYHDRMPLVLPPDLHAAWLDPRADAAQLLREARARMLALPLDIYPSNPLGNNVRFEGPEVVARYSADDAARDAAQAQTQAEQRPKRTRQALAPSVSSAQQSLFGEPAAPARNVPRAKRG